MERTNEPLRIALDARLDDGRIGGVQQVVMGLASAFAEMDGPEEYYFLVGPVTPEWLLPYLRGPCRALPTTTPTTIRWRGWARRLLPSELLRPAYRRLRGLASVRVPASDGTIERAGIDVMHLTVQRGFTTNVPTIYTPYDLQHLHLPELFDDLELRTRAAHYPTLSAQARYVMAISRWGKEDLVRRFGLEREKVAVVHLAPAIDAYRVPTAQELAEIRTRLALPSEFAYYPAQTWRHKNHIRLLEALALLRDRSGLVVPVVFSGAMNDHFPEIEKQCRRLELDSQVRFLGVVTPLEVQAVYRLSRLLVFPSLFEGFGMPVVEAFRLGVPVACSTAPALPEITGRAAERFAPGDPVAMAEAIARVWSDRERRESLARQGRMRAQAFSWKRSALLCRALYRSAASRPLGGEDECLLRDAIHEEVA